MTALAGEVGEAANIVKKLRRLDCGIDSGKPEETYPLLLAELHGEVADILSYLVLFCRRAGINLSIEAVSKFNRVSRNIGYSPRMDGSGELLEDHDATE